MELLETTYEIKLPQFEGPFDLLLFFIERDELDIYNIPIAKVTDDFLEHLREMDVINIELASEFILVASTLMRIKAKMLLPRKDLDEQGNEIDPRKELVDRLLEYKKFKQASEELLLLEENQQKRNIRGYIQKELSLIHNENSTEAELNSLTLFKLLKAFDKVMSRLEEEKNKPKHTVIQYPYTLEQERNYVSELIKTKERVSFENIFSECIERVHAVFRFLSLLELLQLQIIDIQIGVGINNFWLTPKTAIDG